jgi:hypothetical protein
VKLTRPQLDTVNQGPVLHDLTFRTLSNGNARIFPGAF